MKKAAEERVSIAGPAGVLQALLSCSVDHDAYIAVICHPHPLHGGSLDNKVVTVTARACHEMGIPVLRFNFRGVGESEGRFDHGNGEGQDLAACVDWLRSRYPQRKLLLAGFSFGSYVAAKMAPVLQAAGLISIAPPVNLYDFTVMDNSQITWLVIQGDADEVVPAERVRQWLAATPAVDHSVWMAGASHFFHGRLPELSAAIQAWLQQIMQSDHAATG